MPVRGQVPAGANFGANVAVFILKRSTIRQLAFLAFKDDLDRGEEGVPLPTRRVQELGREPAVAVVGMGDQFHRLLVPAGMDGPHPVEVEPHGERAEPLQVGLEFLRGQLFEGRPMLLLVLRRAAAQVFSGHVPVLAVVGQGVQFVVSNHG